MASIPSESSSDGPDFLSSSHAVAWPPSLDTSVGAGSAFLRLRSPASVDVADDAGAGGDEGDGGAGDDCSVDTARLPGGAEGSGRPPAAVCAPMSDL